MLFNTIKLYITGDFILSDCLKRILFHILCLFLLFIFIAIPRKILASDLVLSGTVSDPNTQTSFLLSVYNVPNDVVAFGFDIIYDPNIMEYVDDEEGDIIKDFTYLSNNISNGVRRFAGYVNPPITEDKKIKKDANGVMLKITFDVKKNYGEKDIFLDNLIDDLNGWTTETTLSHGNILAQDAESTLCFLNILN